MWGQVLFCLVGLIFLLNGGILVRIMYAEQDCAGLPFGAGFIALGVIVLAYGIDRQLPIAILGWIQNRRVPLQGAIVSFLLAAKYAEWRNNTELSVAYAQERRTPGIYDYLRLIREYRRSMLACLFLGFVFLAMTVLYP